MKILTVLLLIMSGIANAQNFTPVNTSNWKDVYVNNVSTLSNGDILIYGNGQFLPLPAPLDGCIMRNKELRPLPWEIPNNTEIIIESSDGTLYLGGALGVGKISNGVYEKLVTTQNYIFTMCIYRGSLYFGGTLADINGVNGNIGRYDLATGEITVDSIANASVKSIVPFAKAGEDTSLYVLCDIKDYSFFKLNENLSSVPMSDEERTPNGYIGIEMTTWDNKLVLTCIGTHNDGYLAVFDGYEWELSCDLDRPAKISISNSGKLFVSGTLHSDSTVHILSEFQTINEFMELEDNKGRKVVSVTHGAEVFMAWDTYSTYVIMNDGSWIKNFPKDIHVFRFDDIEPIYAQNILVAPNPSSGLFSVKIPGRFYGYVSITDISGKLVFNELVFGNKFEVSINVKPGIYILKCGNDYTEKIIITH